MKIRILLASVAVALSIYFSQGVAEAEKTVTIDVVKCRANCAANAKKCALAGNVSVATCVNLKNQCLENICGDKGTTSTQ